MKTRIYITIIILIFVNSLIAQNQERNRILTYNILFGGVTAGIGSCINKPKNEKLHKAFIRGFSRGSLGGLVNFTGKKTASLIWKRENLAWGWVSKLIHTTGTSIVDNASAHREFMEVWHMDFMFIRFEIEDKKVDWKVKPFDLGAFTYFSFKYKLDVKGSLALGSSLFKGEIYRTETQLVVARTIINNIVSIEEPEYYYNVITHELTHSLQNSEYLGFNNLFNINKYKHVYIDSPYKAIFYNLYKYDSNPFETGANYFGDN